MAALDHGSVDGRDPTDGSPRARRATAQAMSSSVDRADRQPRRWRFGGSSARQRSIVSRRNDEISQVSIGSGRVRRAVPRRRRRSASVGSKSGSPGRFLISTLTMAPAHASRAAAERRDVGGSSSPRQLDDRPTVGEHGIVVDDEGVVGRARTSSSIAAGTGLRSAAANDSTVFSRLAAAHRDGRSPGPRGDVDGSP